MAEFSEYMEQRDRLDAAEVKWKYSEGRGTSWMVEVVYNDRNGVGNLLQLSSVAEVDAFLGSWCPTCWRIDRRRTAGGSCPSCSRAAWD